LLRDHRGRGNRLRLEPDQALTQTSVTGRPRNGAFEIRAAAQGDEAAVVALWRDCGLLASYNDPIADFRFARARENSDILVATGPTGDIVASVMVGHDGHRGWLYYVSVAPAQRAHGLGRSIVRSGEAWLAARGIAKVQLLVRETNAQAVGFYERIGFETAPRTVLQKWLEKKPAD
jgi:ribosomal protein S18 acetylase RimI-like enzyme